MSSFIPIVSSSPPPLDDGQAAGWDEDEDDDFGNFASAPPAGLSTSDCGSTGGLGFDVDWSQAESPAVLTEGRGSSPDKNASAYQEEETGDANRPVLGQNELAGNATASLSKSGSGLGGKGEGDAATGGDDFADFAAFQEDSKSNSKPQVGSLPLQSTLPERTEVSDSDSTTGRTVETVMEKSRESTTTDSGVFSTDISPVPKSESFSISEGDKIMQSEDETFSDLPQDSQQGFLFPDAGDATTDPPSSDLGQDKGQLLEVKQEQGSDSRSDTPRNEEGAEVSTLGGAQPFSKQEEQGQLQSDYETKTQEGTGVSEQENTDSSHSPSPQHQHEQGTPDCDLSSSGELASSDQENVADLPGEMAGGDSTDRKADLIDGSEVTVDAAEGMSSPSSDSPAVIKSEESTSKDVSDDEDCQDDSDWAAFGTSNSIPAVIPASENGTDFQEAAEPDDLVLRTNSVEFDEEGVCGEEDSLGDFSVTGSSVVSNQVPSAQPAADLPASQSCQEGDAGEEVKDCGDSCGQPESSNTSPPEDSGEDGGEKVTGNEDSDKDDIGDFSFREATKDKREEDDFGDFSSREATNDNDDEDDFGDFASQPLSSDAPAPGADTDDFGAFSGQSAGAANSDDGFGNFSKQTGSGTGSADSGWADFAGPANSKSDAEEDDFGNFSDSVKTAAFQDGFPTSVSVSSPRDDVSLPSLVFWGFFFFFFLAVSVFIVHYHVVMSLVFNLC